MYSNYAILYNNLLQLRLQGQMGPYELTLYQQLATTLKQRARLDELLLQRSIQDVKNGKGFDQASGGTPSQGSST